MEKAVEIMSSVRSSNTSNDWTDWVQFAAVILVVNAVFSLVQGLVALVGPRSYFAVVDGSLFMFDITGWGWWNIVIGAVLLATALALFTGATWARVLAVILTAISAVGQLLLIPVQPWWSVIVIAIDVWIIYALVAHGGRLKRRS